MTLLQTLYAMGNLLLWISSHDLGIVFSVGIGRRGAMGWHGCWDRDMGWWGMERSWTGGDGEIMD